MDRRSLSDENIEDILRQHLRAEVEAIPPETNPWERLRDRLPRQHKKFLGLFDLSLGSAARPALAAVAVLVLVIGVTTWQSLENFGEAVPAIVPLSGGESGRTIGGVVGHSRRPWRHTRHGFFIVIEDNDSESSLDSDSSQSLLEVRQTSGEAISQIATSSPVVWAYPVPTAYPNQLHTGYRRQPALPRPHSFPVRTQPTSRRRQPRSETMRRPDGSGPIRTTCPRSASIRIALHSNWR